MADNNSKDTIYVDIDDEITAIIDKVRQTKARVIALVLPKRAAVMQSVVNMKLLKRAVDADKKSIVLITTESGLLPLAGAVGLYVAKTLTSKPEIPASPSSNLAPETETIDEDMSLLMDDQTEDKGPDIATAAASGVSVGALADAANKEAVATKSQKPVEETLDLGNEKAQPIVEDDKSEATEVKPKAKKDKHLKVPNFDRFRLLLFLGLLLIVVLVVLGILAFSVWPKAVINIQTDASSVNTNVSLNLDTQAQSINTTNGDIPAKVVTEQKTFSQTVNTTGQQNQGTTATGSVTMTASDCFPYSYGDLPFTIPQGTVLSANGLNYTTQSSTTMNPNGFVGKNSTCISYVSSGPTNISAQNPGSSYNVPSGTTFTVVGYSGVTATGSVSGGTDNIVQIVAQADINAATAKINSNNNGNVKQALINQLQGEGLYPIDVTFASSTPQISASPNVGTVANSVTVSATVTYSLYGVSETNLNKLIDANVLSQTSSNQNIISTGLNQDGFKQSGFNGSSDQVTLTTVAVVGPNISSPKIKKQIAGKSAQQIISIIKNDPDVTRVSVKLSPFWVTSAPTNTSKITVVVAKPKS